MKIGMVLQTPFPPDVRVMKEARALLAAGHQVSLLCAPERGRPARDEWEGVRIVRAAVPLRDSLALRLDYLAGLITFRHPSWVRAIRRFIADEAPDALHVHDLMLVRSALTARGSRPLPVVADLHENLPAALSEWNKGRRGLERLAFAIFGRYARWRRHEAAMCRRVDRVIAVVEEMRARLIGQHGLPAERIAVVGNAEVPDFGADAPTDPELAARYAEQYTLLYIGGFGAHRGLDTAIRGVALLRERIPGLRLLLVGRGSPAIEVEMRALAAECGAADRIDWVGWQPLERVPAYIRTATVGLVPHNANEHTEHTVPHKLFQYMVLERPVLVSSCAPLARIVRESGAGRVFRAGDAGDFAEQTLSLYADPAGRAAMARAGRAAATAGPFSWAAATRELLALYEDLGP